MIYQTISLALLVLFFAAKDNLLCAHINSDLFTGEYNMLLSHVKISVFWGVKPHPAFHFTLLKQPSNYWPIMVVEQGLDSKQFYRIHTTQTKQKLKNEWINLSSK